MVQTEALYISYLQSLALLVRTALYYIGPLLVVQVQWSSPLGHMTTGLAQATEIYQLGLLKDFAGQE